jgi:EF-hand domain
MIVSFDFLSIEGDRISVHSPLNESTEKNLAVEKSEPEYRYRSLPNFELKILHAEVNAVDKLDQVHKLAADGMSAFKKLDRDGNGYVSDTELKAALSDTALSAHDKLLYEFLDNNYQKLAASSKDHDPKLGIDQEDLRILDLATDTSAPLSSRAKQVLNNTSATRAVQDLLGAGAGATLALSLGGDAALALASTPIGWVAAGGAAVGALAFEGAHLYRQKYDERNLTKLAQEAKDLTT